MHFETKGHVCAVAAAVNTQSWPWMGARARLKSSFDCNTMVTEAARIICVAMKKYGLIVADNGGLHRVSSAAVLTTRSQVQYAFVL